ncbi:MAG TPA: ribosome maturation factor RimP [Firmicutes bacterium]|nr:ribosome maturation factor RimP [Bacillota bacterium]
MKNKVSELVKEFFLNSCKEYELVDVEFVKERGRKVLRVTIDKEGGITLADCEKISRSLGDYLDQKDPIDASYNLEVSSPGIERPLKKEADFERFSGRRIKVTTYAPVGARKNFTGTLLGLEERNVILAGEEDRYVIPFELIAKAHLIFDYDSKEEQK